MRSIDLDVVDLSEELAFQPEEIRVYLANLYEIDRHGELNFVPGPCYRWDPENYGLGRIADKYVVILTTVAGPWTPKEYMDRWGFTVRLMNRTLNQDWLLYGPNVTEHPPTVTTWDGFNTIDYILEIGSVFRLSQPAPFVPGRTRTPVLDPPDIPE